MSEKKATKEKSEEKQNGSVAGGDSIQQVERIRDIVFGAQMREYDQRFATISRDFARVQQEMTNANEQILSQIKMLDDLIRELNDRLTVQMEEQTQQLTARIEDVDNRQTTKLRDLDTRAAAKASAQEENLNKQTQALRKASSDQFDHLQHSLNQVGEELRTEIRENTERLGDAKTDRATLGQMLIQMGNDLQQGSSDGVFSKLLDELA